MTVLEKVVDGKLMVFKTTEAVPDDLLSGYMPTNECNEYHFDGTVNDEPVTYQFWDTPCIEGWTDEETDARREKRAEVYPLADIVLMCFSIPSPSSFAHIKGKWYPEVKQYNSEAKIVLLGMKTEHRDIEETKEALRKLDLANVSYDDGRRVAAEIGAVKYIECTVLDRESVVRVLEALVDSI